MSRITHISQNRNAFANDCGPACIAMLASAYTDSAVTISQVVAKLSNAHKFTTIAQLVTGLAAFGVKATNTRAATWPWYQERLDAGVPVIALVDYESYSYNPTRYVYAHFLIVAAYTSNKVIAFDPLRDEGPTEIPLGEFINSINTPSAYVGGRNWPNQAVYPVTPLAAPLPPETRTAILGLREAGYAMLQRAG